MIHLLVPGLLGPLPRFEVRDQMPRLPSLERLFARGDRGPGPASCSQALFGLFGLSADASPATAPVAFHADSGGWDEPRYLLHADPIHLRPDQDRLIGFDFQRRPLSVDESAVFVEAFNRHFAGDGLELLAPHPLRWYLAVDHVPRLRCHPLEAIIGRNIDLFLPEGGDAAVWRAWMNEVQMLFHSLPLNAEREARGRWPVSGLWFSGGGHLPADVPGGRIGSLLPPLVEDDIEGRRPDGASAVADGLLRVSRSRGAEGLLCETAPGRALLDGDPDAWLRAVRDFDAGLEALRSEQFRLYTCDGSSWHWQPGMGRHWWRRAKPLSW